MEDRAQPAEGRSRRTGGGSGPTEYWRSTHLSDDGGLSAAVTLRVRADIPCVTVTYTCIFTVQTARKWYWLFLDQSDFKDAVESQIRNLKAK